MIGLIVFLALFAVGILTARRRTKNSKPKPEEILKAELSVEEPRHRLSTAAELPGLTNKYAQPAELADTGIIRVIRPGENSSWLNSAPK